MIIERRNKMTIVMAICLLTLAGTTARADLEPDPTTPLETTFTAGALLNFGRAAQHYHHYLSHGHQALQPNHGPEQDVVSMASGNSQESAASSR
jgi:hypothetical protein